MANTKKHPTLSRVTIRETADGLHMVSCGSCEVPAKSATEAFEMATDLFNADVSAAGLALLTVTEGLSYYVFKVRP